MQFDFKIYCSSLVKLHTRYGLNSSFKLSVADTINYIRKMLLETSIISRNSSNTITVLDVPRSLELAQGLTFSQEKQLISSSPPQTPWTNIPEPKSDKALAKLEPETIDELLLRRYLQLALQEIRDIGGVTWLLPRITDISGQKDAVAAMPVGNAAPPKQPLSGSYDVVEIYQNTTGSGQLIQTSPVSSLVYIPPMSSFICGSIEDSLDTFISTAPKFNLVILDPPWPNRSARRNNSYGTVPHISTLLSSIPLESHLATDALVGVWITNKASFRSFILGPGGFFDRLNIELLEEWVWLKIAASGEPVLSLDSRWRKPYEILLLGQRNREGGQRMQEPRHGHGVKRRVIIAVPDLHSRKPSLKELFLPMLPDRYEALEIFARNLTEGWWAWGNEVCKFQSQDHWVLRRNKATNA